MSEVHRFLFDGMPVRGAIVRLTDAWQEVLRRRASDREKGDFPAPLQDLLGEMSAAAVLMQSNIKFNGALVLQIAGDGPVKLAVVEVQNDLGLRATATVQGDIAPHESLSQMVNQHGTGRCAITLDPSDRLPGQQPYQGVVPLMDADGKFDDLSKILQHYMRQSEQLDTTLVLAANNEVAAGLLIQRLPGQGQGNLAGQGAGDEAAGEEDYQRLAILASSLKREELLALDVDTVLHRLFWQEPLLRFAPDQSDRRPHFHCTCSRERVAKMLLGLGEAEVQSVLAEQGQVDVGCDFCSARYVFDRVDVGALFQTGQIQSPSDSPLH